MSNLPHEPEFQQAYHGKTASKCLATIITTN
jgi:hypothetical protein